MPKKNKGLRVLLTVLCVVLGIVLAAMIAGTVYFNVLVGKIGRVDGNDETYSDEQLQEILKEDNEGNNAPDMDENDMDWGSNEGNLIEKSEDIINILLIGQDAREGWGRSRSDTMMLVTFNTKEKTITLTSFLRDLYVKIPGYKDNKMNATYVFGGMELLNQTLELNFGVQVDGNVEVDFSRFADVIELLGGVDIELRDDEAAYINAKLGKQGISSSLTAGMQTLNGDQALWYSRIRYLDADSDFSRTNRQRKVVNSLIEKFRDTRLTTLLRLLNDLLPMIATDMSNSEILGYAKDLFPMLADCTIVSQRIPADNTYSLRTIGGMSCIVADMDAARKLLEESIGG
jgi:LCP family protein required for cell wall assembly